MQFVCLQGNATHPYVAGVGAVIEAGQSNKAAEGALANAAAQAAGAERKHAIPVTTHWHKPGCVSPLVELSAVEQLWSAWL